MIQYGGPVNQAVPKTYIDLNKVSDAKNNDTKFVNDGIVATVDLATDNVVDDNIVDRFRVDTQNYWTGWTRNYDLKSGVITKPLGLKEMPTVTWFKASEGPLMKFKSRSLKKNIHMQQISVTSLPKGDGYSAERWQARYEVTTPSSMPSDYRPGDPTDPTNTEGWWTDWCLSVFSGQAANTQQIDMPFSVSTPQRNDEDFTFSGHERNYVKIRGNYNYLNLPYEELTSGILQAPGESSTQIPEDLLPNLYTYMTYVEKNQAFKDSNEEVWFGGPVHHMWNHLTFYDALQDLDENALFFKQHKTDAPPYTESKFALANNTINNYLLLWTKGVQDIAQPEIDAMTKRFKIIAFSQSDFEIINNYNSAASYFPMNVEIEIETENPNNFFNALKQTHYNPFLIRYLLTAGTYDTADFVRSHGSSTIDDLTYLSWDLSSFITQVKDSDLQKENTPQDFIFIGADDKGVDFDDPSNSMFNTLMALGLDSKINSLIENTYRSYDQIVQGEECYAETVAYEVEKWSSNGNGQVINKLQSFYLPNDDSTMIKMFDTQVKYNKNYVYRIFAYKIVFGTAYRYSLVTDSIIDEGNVPKSAMVDVFMAPHIRIIRTPYYNVPDLSEKAAAIQAGTVELPTHQTTIVMDEAPLPPEVEIVPLINEPATIIINLKDTIGMFKQTPRPIDDTDIELYQVLVEKQLKDKFNVTNEQLAEIDIMSQEILFKSDEPSEFLQMFHSVQKPVSYYDLANADRNLLNGPNDSVKIKLNFNQKNYFAFRAIDPHGKFSNPTDVYEVEIKEENGMWFPVFRLLNLEEEAKKNAEKLEKQTESFALEGKRFLYIKPAFRQWDMGEKYDLEEYDSPFDIPNFSIGVAEHSVFREDRKFKFRLTSKKTGRKIDINLQCKVKQEKIHNE